MQIGQFRSAKQLAMELGVSEGLVRRKFREGKLEGRKVGRDWIETRGRKFLTAKEYGEKTGYSNSQVRWRLRKGKIKGVKVGRDWIVIDGIQEVRLEEVKKGGSARVMAGIWLLLEKEARLKDEEVKKKAQE